MSKLNPILASSAHSAEAYRQAIAQSSEAVVQWLQQPEMYQGKALPNCASASSSTSPRKAWQPGGDRSRHRVLFERQPVGAPPAVRGAPALPEPGDKPGRRSADQRHQPEHGFLGSEPVGHADRNEADRMAARQVGYQPGDAGVFTSGGTQSNLMGLMLARDAFFARQGHPCSRTAWWAICAS